MKAQPGTGKSWREKLERPPKGLPKVVQVPAEQQKRFGGSRLLVPTPLLVDGLIHKVRKRKLITVHQIRHRLAEDFNADATCPLTTGIFLRIIAAVAQQDIQMGRTRVTPYWRVINSDGSLNPKLPGGVEAQAALLKAEGHNIIGLTGAKLPRSYFYFAGQDDGLTSKGPLQVGQSFSFSGVCVLGVGGVVVFAGTTLLLSLTLACVLCAG